jgi:hypothetical protein
LSLRHDIHHFFSHAQRGVSGIAWRWSRTLGKHTLLFRLQGVYYIFTIIQSISSTTLHHTYVCSSRMYDTTVSTSKCYPPNPLLATSLALKRAKIKKRTHTTTTTKVPNCARFLYLVPNPSEIDCQVYFGLDPNHAERVQTRWQFNVE